MAGGQTPKSSVATPCQVCSCLIGKASIHIASPILKGNRICASCALTIKERIEKQYKEFVEADSKHRYVWTATMEDGQMIPQFNNKGERRSIDILDFSKVKRIQYESNKVEYPPVSLHVKLDKGERGISFYQMTANAAGGGLVDARQVVGIQKPVAGHSVKFFVLLCADGHIIVSSTDNIE